MNRCSTSRLKKNATLFFFKLRVGLAKSGSKVMCFRSKEFRYVYSLRVCLRVFIVLKTLVTHLPLSTVTVHPLGETTLECGCIT